MSTPLTDKRCEDSQKLQTMAMRFAWMCDHSRRLERDLTALRARLETLRTAAKDMLSTYRHDGKTVLVTEERQEAWQKAIDESETI